MTIRHIEDSERTDMAPTPSSALVVELRGVALSGTGLPARAADRIEQLERELAEAKALAERQMNDAEDARLSLAALPNDSSKVGPSLRTDSIGTAHHVGPLVPSPSVDVAGDAVNAALAKLNGALHKTLLETGLVTVEQWNADIAPYLKSVASVVEGTPIHARSYRVHESVYPAKSTSATSPTSEAALTALRELADGYFTDPMGHKFELSILGRTQRETLIKAALFRTPTERGTK